jgi:tetratricopeptide (TPR) repeat protein
VLEDGQKEKARYCFQQAEKLAPNVPPIRMRAAFFHFQMEETEAAIQCSARVLKTAPDYDQAIFNYDDRLAPSVEAVLPHLGDDRRAGKAYLRHLLGAEATGRAATAWEWLREQRFADDRLAAEYVDLLLKQRMTEDAVEVWAS